MLDKASEIKLKGVHKDLEAVIRRAYTMTPTGPNWSIVQGVRTQAYQDSLYAQGRTKPGRVVTWTRDSRHIGGFAVDFCHVVNGQLEWNNLSAFKSIAADIKIAAKELGVAIVWGGDWSTTKDWGHIELDKTIYPKGSNASHLKTPPSTPLPLPKTTMPGAVAKLATEWTVAPAIKNYMKNTESFQGVAYWDGNDYAFGFGHNASSGIAPFPEKGSTITRVEADALFDQDLEAMSLQYIKRYVKVPMYQWEFGALASWIYNTGIGSVIEFDVFNLMNQGKDAEVAQLIVNDVPPEGTKYHNGILKRRTTESNYFLGKGLI